MKKYIKKPIPIEAVQWTGGNRAEIANFCNQAHFIYHDTAWKAGVTGVFVQLVIHTLEGDMTANQGDWIIKGVRGEFYPCAKDIFETTYEEVKDDKMS